jgi:DNA-binding ferritin-like protein
MDFTEGYTVSRKTLSRIGQDGNMMLKDYTSSGDSLDYRIAHCAKELMLAAVSFHLLHLKVKDAGSFSAHKALGELYEALPGHADALVEGYQGACERICECNTEMLPKILNSVEDSLSYIRELTSRVTELQSEIPYSEIVNDLDTLKSTFNSAKYKLKFLK